MNLWIRTMSISEVKSAHESDILITLFKCAYTAYNINQLLYVVTYVKQWVLHNMKALVQHFQRADCM